MRHNKQTNRAEMGAHIGSASIVMIFAVLCLTVFAALSFETANYEYRLAHKTADAAGAYYRADSIAEETYAQICTVLEQTKDWESRKAKLAAMQVQIEQTGAQVRLRYRVPIDDTQALEAVLLWEEDVLSVARWNVVAAASWEYDENLHVWDGSIDEAG